MERIVGKVTKVIGKYTYISFIEENANGSIVLQSSEHYEYGDAVLVTLKRSAGSMEITRP
jgi:Tfp pilus assembly protein PilZ